MQNVAVLVEDTPAEAFVETPSSARVPHLTAAAFCLTAATRETIRRASEDRRLTRVKSELSDGGIAKARQAFETRRTPSLLVVEVATEGDALLKELEALAEVCDEETQVVVIGTRNDIDLFRALMARGIAEYLVSPITPLDYVSMVQRLFAEESTAKLGTVHAFVGAKGGVGSSTLAQNVAWTMAEEEASPTLLLDLDFKFGSTAINLDLKPVTGLEKYLDEPDKLDAALLDRLTVQRGEYLSVLPGLDETLSDQDPAPDAIERLIEVARASFPRVVLDLPHEWSVACRDALAAADEVVVVASPDLPNLRNARVMMERVRALRPNDAPPRIVLNTCRMPKRKEIPADKFATSVGVETCAMIEFDAATFGNAMAEGSPLREKAPRSKAQTRIRELVQTLAGQHNKRPRSWLRRMFGLA